MEYIRIALAANLNRAADTLERLARGAEAEPTSTEQLEEMQAQVDAGAAVWGAVLHGLLKVPEIVEHVDELTASGYTEPDSLVGSGQESANLFLSVMTDFVYPLGEATTPTYSLCDRWEPSDDHHAMYRRNELRSESTGCRLLARLIETGGATTPVGQVMPATIPSEDRTMPMSFRRAARLMGKGDSQDAAEWLSQSVKDGSIPCESVTRQTHFFSRASFPKSAWPQVCPGSDGKST